MTHLHIQDGAFVSHSQQQPVPAVQDVLRRAQSLLAQLHAARRCTEQRLSETGRADPIKTVTGRSSLDNAIDRTEQLIDELRDMNQQDEPTRSEVLTIDTGYCRALLQSPGGAYGSSAGSSANGTARNGSRQRTVPVLMR